MRRLLQIVVAALALASPAAAEDMTIVPTPTLRCNLSAPCKLGLDVRDGSKPFRWRLSSGDLPSGMTLDSETGVISGTPTVIGDFRPVIAVTDSSSSPQTASRTIVISVTALLVIEWRDVPRLRDTSIGGSLRVTNQTGDDVTLTVVVVAVNQIGKAFTLGYQHFTLAASRTSPDIPFGQTLPSGQYRVHTDVVGEVLDKNRIYRAAADSQRMTIP